jgi:hypothetical protein
MERSHVAFGVLANGEDLTLFDRDDFLMCTMLLLVLNSEHALGVLRFQVHHLERWFVADVEAHVPFNLEVVPHSDEGATFRPQILQVEPSFNKMTFTTN